MSMTSVRIEPSLSWDLEIAATFRRILEEASVSEETSVAAPLRIYQQIVDSSPDCIFAVGTDYRFIAVNEIYLRRTGLIREQIVGRHVAAIMGQAVFDQALRPWLDRCLSGETIRSRELVRIRSIAATVRGSDLLSLS